MMNELKPCYFCGSSEVGIWFGEADRVAAVCTWCFAQGPEARDIYEAIDKWNSIHVDTCKNISDPPEGFLCSECRWGDFAEPSHLLGKNANYCPNCGRKVEHD